MDNLRLDIACEQLRDALKKNTVTSPFEKAERKWAEMQLLGSVQSRDAKRLFNSLRKR